jgi:hypothetical protein
MTNFYLFFSSLILFTTQLFSQSIQTNNYIRVKPIKHTSYYGFHKISKVDTNQIDLKRINATTKIIDKTILENKIFRVLKVILTKNTNNQILILQSGRDTIIHDYYMDDNSIKILNKNRIEKYKKRIDPIPHFHFPLSGLLPEHIIDTKEHVSQKELYNLALDWADSYFPDPNSFEVRRVDSSKIIIKGIKDHYLPLRINSEEKFLNIAFTLMISFNKNKTKFKPLSFYYYIPYDSEKPRVSGYQNFPLKNNLEPFIRKGRFTGQTRRITYFISELFSKQYEDFKTFVHPIDSLMNVEKTE